VNFDVSEIFLAFPSLSLSLFHSAYAVGVKIEQTQELIGC